MMLHGSPGTRALAAAEGHSAFQLRHHASRTGMHAVCFDSVLGAEFI
jgi:hypothetical protein